MKISRRSFMQKVGMAGAAVALGQMPSAASVNRQPGKSTKLAERCRQERLARLAIFVPEMSGVVLLYQQPIYRNKQTRQVMGGAPFLMIGGGAEVRPERIVPLGTYFRKVGKNMWQCLGHDIEIVKQPGGYEVSFVAGLPTQPTVPSGFVLEDADLDLRAVENTVLSGQPRPFVEGDGFVVRWPSMAVLLANGVV